MISLPSFKKPTDSALQEVLVVIVIISVAVAVAAGLIMRGQITKQNDVNVELSEKLDELNKENTRLKTAILSYPNLEMAEEQALNKFGMLKPGTEVTEEINIGKNDRAVVLNTAENAGLFEKNGAWISSVRNILLNGK